MASWLAADAGLAQLLATALLLRGTGRTSGEASARRSHAQRRTGGAWERAFAAELGALPEASLLHLLREGGVLEAIAAHVRASAAALAIERCGTPPCPAGAAGGAGEGVAGFRTVPARTLHCGEGGEVVTPPTDALRRGEGAVRHGEGAAQRVVRPPRCEPGLERANAQTQTEPPPVPQEPLHQRIAKGELRPLTGEESPEEVSLRHALSMVTRMIETREPTVRRLVRETYF